MSKLPVRTSFFAFALCFAVSSLACSSSSSHTCEPLTIKTTSYALTIDEPAADTQVFDQSESLTTATGLPPGVQWVNSSAFLGTPTATGTFTVKITETGSDSACTSNPNAGTFTIVVADKPAECKKDADCNTGKTCNERSHCVSPSDGGT